LLVLLGWFWCSVSIWRVLYQVGALVSIVLDTGGVLSGGTLVMGCVG